MQPETFQGKEGVERMVWLGHFDKDFVKHQKKKSRLKTYCSFFSYILLKLHFEWEIPPKDGHNKGFSFKSQDAFFDFQKGLGRPPLSP